MNQNPSNRRKYLFPAAVVIIVIAAALVVVNGNIGAQGASLFIATDRAALSKNTANLMPCRMGSTTPTLKVFAPNGGEVFTAGQQVVVNWGTCNIPANEVIEITLNNGSNVYSLVANTQNVLASAGQAVVTLPTQSNWSGFQSGNFYKVSVYATHAPFGASIAEDSSDNLFTINGAVATNCVENNPRRFGLIEDELALATTTHPNNGSPNIANLGDFKIDPAETAAICSLKGISVIASANPMLPLSSVRIVDVATNQVVGSTSSFQSQVGGSWNSIIPVSAVYSLEPGKRFRIEGVLRGTPTGATEGMLVLGVNGFRGGTNSVSIDTRMDLYSRVLSLQ